MKKKKTKAVVKASHHLVFYTKGCVPHVGLFKSYSLAEKFVSKFSLNHSDNPDNWVDCIIEGSIKRCFKGFEGIVIDPSKGFEAIVLDK